MLRAMKIRPYVQVCSLSMLAGLLVGCAYGEVRQVIRAQFANDTGCAAVKLQKRSTWYAEEDPNQYKVRGCGVVRTYTCADHDLDDLVSYDEPACTWVDGDADAPKINVQTADDSSGGLMDESLDAPMDPAMDAPMDAPADDESSEPEADEGAAGEPEPEAQPAAKPKAKAKGKLSGGIKLGGSAD
jgi:hypothetical protein